MTHSASVVLGVPLGSLFSLEEWEAHLSMRCSAGLGEGQSSQCVAVSLTVVRQSILISVVQEVASVLLLCASFL